MSLKKKILASALIALAGFPMTSGAKTKNPNVNDLRESITDNAIVFPESFEQNTLRLMEEWYLSNYTATDDAYAKKKDPNVNDATLKARLLAMNTKIDMPFNQIVRAYIDNYTKKSRHHVAALLGLSTYYIPIFEQELEAQGLPLELKYLPVIESGLDPNAVSSAGATGLWQLMLATARGLDMEVSSLVDERRDPYQSSKKAVELLKKLYNTYDDWSLAIAAYNCGAGTVNKALRRAGGDPASHDFWSIYEYLPKETKGYVPKFIAANYVMTYYRDHDISPVLATKPLITDTVGINYRVNFDQISEVLNIPIQEIRILNPQYRQDVIPGAPGKTYFLTLPAQQIAAYIVSEDEIMNAKTKNDTRKNDANDSFLAANDGNMPGNESVENSGEDWSQLPEEPDNSTVTEVRRKKATEETAQVTPAPQSRQETARQNPTDSNRRHNGSRAITHKVGSSETLASIAQYYNVEEEEIKQWNNLNRDAVRTGQQLRIFVSEDAVLGSSAGRATASGRTSTPAKENNVAQKTPVGRERNTQPAAATTRQTVANNPQPARTQPKTQSSTPALDKARANNNKAQAANGKNTGKSQTPALDKAKGKDGKNQQAANNKNAKDNGKNAKNAKEQQVAQQKPAKPVTHKVAAGESLEKIAKKHGVSVEEIRQSNPGIKGDHIRPDQELKIPSKNQAANAKNAKDNKAQQANAKNNGKNTKDNKNQQAANAKNAKDNDNKNAKDNKPQQAKSSTHKVAAGDNLEKIAKKHGVSVDDLRKSNPGIKGDHIRPDQELKIPSKKAEPKAKAADKNDKAKTNDKNAKGKKK